MFVLPLAISLLSLTPQDGPVGATPPDEEGAIVVEGERLTAEEAWRERNAEQPYSTTPRTVLGTRIARVPERRTYNTVSTDTGLAGLISGPDNNMDAASGAVRNRLVRVCRADREEVSEASACALNEAREKIEASDFAQAAEILDTLLQTRHLSSWDRYYAGHYAFLLGQNADDPAQRRIGLTAMLASGRMEEGERPAAMRSLVSLALAAGDEEDAIRQLEALLDATPDDAQNQANLAILYGRQGRADVAKARMALAVDALRSAGRAPPESWTAFLQH